MSLSLHWFLPTYGDSRGLISGGHGQAMRGDRPADLRYLTQVALAAETNGFDSVLTPTGAWCEDAWLTTAALIENTDTLRFLVALRPGLVGPTLAAQMASTFQHLSAGRLLLNVVVGGESHEQRAYGDDLDKEARYERCDEFLDIVRRLWADAAPVTYRGRRLAVADAALARRPDPVPPLFFGGSSAAALPVAARHADTYLTWGEPPAAVGEKLRRVRELAAAHGRTPDFGVRLHVITRDTGAEAWAAADRLQGALDPAVVARVQAGLARSESEGQRRMRALNDGGRALCPEAGARSLEVAPNLWAGVGLVRGGAGTALVGSHTEVADRLAEYAESGVRHVVLSGYPHLEEAFHVGEGLVPELRARGLLGTPADASTAAAGAAGIPFAAAI